jgi:hypothetical protein
MAATATIATLLLAAAVRADAQTRWVVVNGQRLSDAQVAHFDRLQCNAIPNGHYWLDERSGVWGYAGSPQPQGRVGDGCLPLNGLGRLGPYATQRRAHEAAADLRARGVGAVVLHDGDGWYVQPQR